MIEALRYIVNIPKLCYTIMDCSYTCVAANPTLASK